MHRVFSVHISSCGDSVGELEINQITGNYFRFIPKTKNNNSYTKLVYRTDRNGKLDIGACLLTD